MSTDNKAVPSEAPRDRRYTVEEQLSFKRVLSEISARLLQMPGDQVESQVLDGLKAIAGFFQVERCTLTEYLQTLDSIVAAVRPQWGCLLCTFSRAEEARTIHVVQRWSDQAAFDAYLRSREHRALLGAIETLCEHHTLSTMTQ